MLRFPLHVIGCGALVLQVEYERGTTDSDVLETAELLSAQQTRDMLHVAETDFELDLLRY